MIKPLICCVIIGVSCISHCMEKKKEALPICIITATPEVKKVLADFERWRLEHDVCGICREPGLADIAWPYRSGNGAHEQCFDLIKNSKFYTTLRKRSKTWSALKMNEAHKEAISTLENIIKKTGCSTFKKYADKEGNKKLIAIFDSEGIKALKGKLQ